MKEGVHAERVRGPAYPTCFPLPPIATPRRAPAPVPGDNLPFPLSSKDLEGRSLEIREAAALNAAEMGKEAEGVTTPNRYPHAPHTGPPLPHLPASQCPTSFSLCRPHPPSSPRLLSLQIRKPEEWSAEDACGAAPLPQADPDASAAPGRERSRWTPPSRAQRSGRAREWPRGSSGSARTRAGQGQGRRRAAGAT